MSQTPEERNPPARTRIPDAQEGSLRTLDDELVRLLLRDRTTGKNILWATTEYAAHGEAFGEFCEIRPEHVTGNFASLIQPRFARPGKSRRGRTKAKAEVCTPARVCNCQNNLVDDQWFGRENVFNVEQEKSWTATPGPVSFDGLAKGWKDYVDAPRLEMACGEAPYLVSPYDAVTGEKIALGRRNGLLDRKMRVVRENAETASEWLIWSRRAYESIYGFEYQGDSLLLARENLLSSYTDYYLERFRQPPGISLLRGIARVIAWNIWQMDGLKCVVPGSCGKNLRERRLTGSGNASDADRDRSDTDSGQCPGCAGKGMRRHTGTYCRIMDWRARRSRTFLSLTAADLAQEPQ